MRRENVSEWMWIDIGDSRECDDCAELGGQVDTLQHWQQTGMPRERGTICGSHCRCILLPTDITEDEAEQRLGRAVDQAIDEMVGRVRLDLRSGRGGEGGLGVGKGGRSILLRDFEQIEGLATLPYERVAELEEAIADWKGDELRTLPAEFYRLANVDRMIDWLRSNP